MTTGAETLAPSTALIIVAVAAGVSGALIAALFPLLQRHALARPNARSSHRTPTPQGGGVAVIASTLLVGAGSVAFLAGSTPAILLSSSVMVAATVLLAIVGGVDDLRPMPVVPRLVLQGLAILVALAALPADMRVLPWLPWWIERIGLFVGLLWFVNLTNFMDGIDWMTVAEVVPMTAVIGIAGTLGLVALPVPSSVAALALLGATLGFAPFNKPMARLFLGDVGSLPVGLLLGWLLLQLAAAGALAAAALLPLYYLADATLTLLRRMAAGERIWQAHRTHFYQRAGDAGLSVPQIIARVWATNLALAALAFATIIHPGRAVAAASLAAGVLSVGLLLASFVRGKR